MSTQKTTHYSLHKWVPEDPFLREEFNENFATLDDQVFKAARVAVGYYTGNGSEWRTLTLPFQPRAVFVIMRDGLLRGSSDVYGGLAVTGSPARSHVDINSPVALQIVTGGFQVHSLPAGTTGPHLNLDGSPYQYLALR